MENGIPKIPSWAILQPDSKLFECGPLYCVENCETDETGTVCSIQGFHVNTTKKLSTLQKQIGCFNHRVVNLVADKPKRQWLCTIYFADYIRQLERKLPRLSYNQHLAVSNH